MPETTGRAPLVEAVGLRKSFGSGDHAETVVKDAHFRIANGSMVALLGPSGSGKSTLLNLLGLLLPADGGTLLIEGEPVAMGSANDRAHSRLVNTALVFQSFHLIEHKTVAQNIELPLLHLGLPRAERARRVGEVLERLEIAHRATAHPGTLSGGEKQRVAIARAIVTEPRVLLCDEPTGSLDSRRTAEVMDLLRSVTTDDRATVVVTHDQAVAARCDEVLRIDDGELHQVTAPAAVPDATTPTEVTHRSVGRSRSGRPGHWAAVSSREAMAAVWARMRRNLFTMIGVGLGVAALVLSVGFTATVSAQLSDKFNGYLAQRVTVTRTDLERAPLSTGMAWDQSAALRRINGLNGVEAAGVIQEVGGGAVTVTTAPEPRDQFPGRVQAPVRALSDQGMSALGATVSQGRMFDAGHARRGDPVLVVGRATLQALGRPWVPGLQLYVDGQRYTVIGVVEEDLSAGGATSALYVPLSERAIGSSGVLSVLVKTSLGAAQQVAGEIPPAFLPEHPDRVLAAAPPEPRTLTQAVDEQQRILLLGMSLVTLVIGGVGIMNTFLVAVMERRREIGLRLALGAPPRAMTLQFGLESVVTAMIGSLGGTAVAVNVLAVVSLVNHWTPVISGTTIGLGLVAGVVLGLVAGVYPARKAAGIDPVAALSHA